MPSKDNKYRSWFVEVNQNAECYTNVLEILKECNFDLYAYIEHDKDVELTTNDNGEVLEVPKSAHKHFCLELVNPITFKSLQAKFKGAHIEVMKFKKSSYQYLIHNTENAKEKYQYDFNKIISNDLDRVKRIIEEESKEVFNEDEIVKYFAQGTLTKYAFVKRFGLECFKRIGRQYMELVAEIGFDSALTRDVGEARKRIQEEVINDLVEEFKS